MALRELLLKLDVDVDKQGVKSANNALGGLKKAAIGLGTIFATGALARGGRALVDLASDFEETTNVIDASFGANAKSVEDWAVVTAKEVGRSRAELRQMAGELGALLNPAMEGNSEAAAKMSTDLTKLAVDLGSFFNANEPEVLLALRAGLVGSTEPLLKFGINLQVAQLQAFALSKGITKTVLKMSNAEKTALRYQLIMAKTANAQGDAAKTAAGFANLSKRLGGVLKDVGIEIGTELLPVAIELINVLIPLAKGLGKALITTFRVTKTMMGALSITMKSIIFGFKDLGAILGTVTVALTALGVAFLFVGKQGIIAAVKVGFAWLTLMAPLFLTIAAIAAISAAIFLLVEDFNSFASGGESAIGKLVTAITGFEGQVTSTGEAVELIFQAMIQSVKDFANELSDAFDPLERLGIGVHAQARSASKAFKERRRLASGVTDAIGRSFQFSVAPQSGTTSSFNNKSDVKVEVNVPFASNPQQVGAETKKAVEKAMDGSLRQAKKTFDTSKQE